TGDTAGGAGDMTAGAGDTTAGDGSGCSEPSLDLVGLMFSPGGDVLPRGCEPFHPTLNNPYAVRCIDAWPWYETQFPGDEFCILPPEPGKGIQVGVHPQNLDWYTQVSAQDLSGYDAPSDAFVMAAGEEEEENYITTATNDAEHNFYRSYVRMRAGSHHMIVSADQPAGTAGTWQPGSASAGLSGNSISIPGAQRPDENTPQSLAKPEEDAGLYRRLPPNLDVTFNMHHFNSTDQTILKEAWINIWWEEDASIEVHGIFGMPIEQVVFPFAQPGQTVDYHAAWNVSQDIRVVRLFGHRHAWTPNFSAWVERQDGSTEILYQSFDWFDMPTFRYDSIVQNPAPAPEIRVDGGASGVQIVEAGDQLHFNCHMAYTPERATQEGAPMPTTIGPLRFANEAFTGEMCILFGETAGLNIGRPAANGDPLPDFATLE
ncbi:MAG: hypothetical protein PVI30_25370, partial [Myxococcales bacterium]